VIAVKPERQVIAGSVDLRVQSNIETAEFDIASLEGIGHCPNLTEFLVIAMTAKLDLRPLLTLPRLKKVGLAHSGAEAGADAASNEAVKDVLRQRGVTVN